LATETEQLQRIREYLGWQPFDPEARTRLTPWLTQRATDDVLPSDLVTRAKHILPAWQIVLPARSTLDTLVVSVTTHVHDTLSTQMATPMAPALQQAFDALLDVPAGGHHSRRAQLKEYPQRRVRP
jgi:hypothetical protein